MNAYHGLQAVKDQRIAAMREYIAREDLVRGPYGPARPRGWRVGWVVFCTEGSNDLDSYEREVGIPVALTQLRDEVFATLSDDRFLRWPVQFLEAIPVGADLSLVVPQFAVWLMVDPMFGVLQYANAGAECEAIEAVAGMYLRISAGEVVQPTEMLETCRAAEAARAAAEAEFAGLAMVGRGSPSAYAAEYALATSTARAVSLAYVQAFKVASAMGKKLPDAAADELLRILSSEKTGTFHAMGL